MRRIQLFLGLLLMAITMSAAPLTLVKGQFRISLPDNADAQVKLAAQIVAKDVNKVMGFTPTVGAYTNSGMQVCVVQADKSGADQLLTLKKPLDDFESHRVYTDAANNRVYLYGKDMRGTIYAIYTFAEKVLGVPPLWYWSSWEPEKHESITIPDGFDVFFKSPRVRYRAWFPNDTDLFTPWQKNNTSRQEAWLETLLRLKLNTVEVEGGVMWDGTIGLNDDCKRLQKFGICMTSHHHTPLAGGFVHWNEFWKNVKKQSTVPELTVANDTGKKNIYTFWQHCIDCVKKANIEYIWLIGFRGSGDHAWWESGDSNIKVAGDPGNDKARADVINTMTQKMYDMIKSSTGESNPFVRMTFYNELSNLMAAGYLKPPSASNMLWTYVAARRDHYPSQDLRNHTNNNVKVGLYMNFQFTSTGSHLAPAEGPWKMEYNYRYAMTKAPLQFSVVNMGNLREYMMEASANAALLWDWDNYTTDNFMVKYSAMYFGKQHARDIAQLYHDYYYSYWNQHASDFQNMPRQYVFQDLRYGLAFSDIKSNFDNGKINIFDDGKYNIGNHNNELNDLISGIGKSAKSFTDVLDRADAVGEQLESRYKTFFNDNFLQYARFMAGISQSLYHFAYASKNTSDRNGHGGAAIGMYTQGQRALFAAQHGEFSGWINNASGAKFGIGYRYGHITNKVSMDNCKFDAGTKSGNTWTYKQTESKAGVLDVLVKYNSASDGWLNVKVNNTTYRKYCPKTGSTKSVGETNGYLIVTAQFNAGENTISISGAGGTTPNVQGIHATTSAATSAAQTSFESIQPSANIDLSWNILDGSNGGGQSGTSTPVVIGSLVPTTPSKAPDYYCTWNLQGYVTSYANGSGSNDLRVELNEDNLFGSQYGYKAWGKNTKKTVGNGDGTGTKSSWTVDPKYQGWLNHYPSLHQDLMFVMDDSWDIPKGKLDGNGVCDKYGSSKRPNGSNYDNPYLATLTINAERFPSFTGNDVQRMTGLVNAVKAKGWKSMGGWVAAQNPINLTKEYTGKDNTMANSKAWTTAQEEKYWKKRMQESVQAGFLYWKVDWGNKDRDDTFRKNLSKWAREAAPDLYLENASFQDGGTHKPQYIPFSRVIRSYDVDNNIAQAQTLQRLKDLGAQNDAEREGYGIINCEDEPYIAAGLGCAIGVMRHPYVGNMPNGKQDTYFNDGSRKLKNRLNETVRAVRWHRIAEPFSHKKSEWKSDGTLTESGGGKSWNAPARISRRLPLPTITGSGATNGNRPFVMACAYDNGCSALAIVNRNINGTYQSQRVDVSFEPLRWDCKVGIFGLSNSVTLRYQNGLPSGNFTVFAQDLAYDGAPTAIAYTKTSDGKGITISGSVIDQLCKGHDYPYSEVQKESGRDYTDRSDPAIVLLIVSGEVNQDSQFYLYNVGAKQWVKTGGLSKIPDSPALVSQNERSVQILTPQGSGKYSIADPEYPAGWGVQGRNTIYESNNGAVSTKSWGTTMTPGFTFTSTGDADGSVYIEYSWDQWTKGNLDIADPSNKTYALYYGDWALSTAGWNDSQKAEVADKGVYSDLTDNKDAHGDYAKWLVVPVKNGKIEVKQSSNTQFYLYNVGQNKWIKTGGLSKNPDSPALADQAERTANVIVKQADGTYTIADPEYLAGWGVQGRNTIYESNNGSVKTNSWGTTLIPGFKFVSTGDANGSVYIEYTWGQWTKGNLNIADPSNKTYALYYGDWALGTDGWNDAQKADVAAKGVYSDLQANETKYGADAKWLIVPVTNGKVDVLPARESEVVVPETPRSVSVTMSDNGVATYSSAYPLDFTSVLGVRAYIATGYNSETGGIVLTRVDEVPANTGLMLKGAAGTYNVPVQDNMWYVKSLLEPVVTATTVAAGDANYVNFYYSNSGSNGAGYYRINAPMSIGANRAYLHVPVNSEAAKARVLNLEFDDETTGIKNVDREINGGETRVYDLQGRQVRPTRRGIYIRNDRKIIIQ